MVLRRHNLLLLCLILVCFCQLIQAQSVKPNGIVALLTDYGDKDFYVGAIKGVIFSRFSQAKVVDITHRITSYNIEEGAFTLLMSAKEFPTGTVFVAIVDPGVGTTRKPIVVVTNDGKLFVGPDNGLFTLVMQEFGVKEVREITNKTWMRKGRISTSFHGRDIFAPTAAMLASGKRAADAGPELKDYVTLKLHPAEVRDGKIIAEVVFIDQYGNIQINSNADMLERIGAKTGSDITVKIGTVEKQCRVATTYGDVPQGSLLLFRASTDLIEIAINEGSAAAAFNAGLGAKVTIQK
jgi:S-adenosylmethionine hydrolase